MTEQEALVGKIKSAIICQDQIVFLYDKGDPELVVRYLTPLSCEEVKDAAGTVEDYKILGLQHLPKKGYRTFFASNMSEVHRVISKLLPESVPE